MRFLFWILSISLVLFARPEVQAQGITELGEFSEPVTSLSAYGEGGIALLTKDSKILLVDSTGKKETVYLPPRKDGAPADFCDLSMKGTMAYLCRFQEPVLYLFDVKKPQSGYQLLSLKNFPKERQVINVLARETQILITDTANAVSTVDETGSLSSLPTRTIAIPTSKGTTIQLLPPDFADAKSVWNITQDGGKNILSRSAPSDQVRVKNIRLLGIDGQDRLVFLEATGKGPMNNVFTLYAAKDGAIVSSLAVESPGNITVARYHALLNDGSIALLRPGQSTPLRLIRVTLP